MDNKCYSSTSDWKSRGDGGGGGGGGCVNSPTTTNIHIKLIDALGFTSETVQNC